MVKWQISIAEVATGMPLSSYLTYKAWLQPVATK